MNSPPCRGGANLLDTTILEVMPAGASALGGVIQIGQVQGECPDEERYPDPPVGGC